MNTAYLGHLDVVNIRQEWHHSFLSDHLHCGTKGIKWGFSYFTGSIINSLHNHQLFMHSKALQRFQKHQKIT